MLLVALALASAMSGPDPRDASSIFRIEDFPASALSKGRSRFLLARSTVGTDGRVQNCVAERPSGDLELDALSCSILRKRSRFTPSRWVDGSLTYAVIRTPVNWIIGGPLSKKDVGKVHPADVEVTVASLPPGIDAPVRVSALIAVDENGRKLDCIEMPKSPRSRDETPPAALVKVACKELTAKYAAIPARNEVGKPVRSVQNATVDFVLAR